MLPMFQIPDILYLYNNKTLRYVLAIVYRLFEGCMLKRFWFIISFLQTSLELICDFCSLASDSQL